MSDMSFDVPFDDKDAFLDFMLMHGLAHDKIAQVMYGNGQNYTTYPLFDTPVEDRNWLLDHQAEHQSIFTLRGLVGLPDLASVDFNKEDEFMDWFLQHSIVHEQINANLGIV